MKRLPIVLSVTALVIAVLGVTPLGQATRDALPLARNADRVDQIHASKTPKAGKLYPLGRNAKFPAAVLSVRTGPRGNTGPVGPQGPPGTPGTPGPPGLTNADQWTFVVPDYGNPEGWLPIVNGYWPDVQPFMTRVIDVHLDKGNYVITFQVIVKNASGQGLIVCVFGNDTRRFWVNSNVGSAAGFAIRQTLAGQYIFKLAEPENFALSCFNSPNGPVGSPGVGYATVIATRVDTATVTLVD